MEWISVKDRLPENGNPVEVKIVMRYKRYKPQAIKQGYKGGRWQEWNGYGWKNTDIEVTEYLPKLLKDKNNE